MSYEPRPGGARAVLIGVADYDSWGDIGSARANVRQLSEVLAHEGQGGLPADAVTGLISPSRGEIIDAVGRAADEATDLLLCYFSGHGWLDLDLGADRSQLWLMPREAEKKNPKLHGIRYTDLRNSLVGSRAATVVVILDCCYSANAHRDPPHGRRFALITSSQPQRRHWKGDHKAPTPFTSALLTVLRNGVSDTDPVTVGSVIEPLRRQAERDKKRATYPAGDWEPNLHSVGGADDTVLSASTTSQRGSPLAGGEDPPGGGQARRALIVSLCLLGVAGVAGGGWWLDRERPWETSAHCPMPLQLRILTTPEYEAPLTRVIEEFEVAEPPGGEDQTFGDRPEGCRQVDTYVYSAPGGDVADAFAESAWWTEPQDCDPGECPQPLRDVGPLPDVWLPSLSASVEPARVDLEAGAPEQATLGDPQTVARVPAVVAVPGELADVRGQTGHRLGELLEAVGREELPLRRAVPASSAAALAFGVAAEDTGTPLDDDKLPSDDRDLLCSLGAEEDRPALLLAERSVVPLIDRDEAPACLYGFWSPTSDNYTAYYPTDVAPLDLSFVSVNWEDADDDEEDRTAAIAMLRDWLLTDEGQDALARQGFRGPHGEIRSEASTPLDDNAFADATGQTAEDLPAERASRYLTDYEQQQLDAPRDVVFVVDLSSGSYTGTRQQTTNAVLHEAINALSPGDRYAVHTTPGQDGGDPLRELDTWGEDDADAVIDSFQGIGQDAAIAQAIEAGLAELADSQDRAQMLVLITDDEDSDTDDQPERATTGAPITVVSLGRLGCDEPFNEALVRGRDRCIDSSRDQVSELAETLQNLGATEQGQG